MRHSSYPILLFLDFSFKPLHQVIEEKGFGKLIDYVPRWIPRRTSDMHPYMVTADYDNNKSKNELCEILMKERKEATKEQRKVISHW